MRVSLRSADGPGRRPLASVAILLPWLVVGCDGEPGPPRRPVAGEVKLDGAPLPSGTITFAPIEGGAGAFGEINNGVYRFGAIDGPSPGRHHVEIVAIQTTGKRIPSPDLPGELVDELRNIIPSRYNARTELQVEVRPDVENAFRFDLSSRKPAPRAKRR
jgi:hypothetical protein